MNKHDPSPAQPAAHLIDIQNDLPGTVDRVEAMVRGRVRPKGECRDEHDHRNYSDQARRAWLLELRPHAQAISAGLTAVTAEQLRLDQKRAFHLNTLDAADTARLVQMRRLVGPLSELVRDVGPAAANELKDVVLPPHVRRRRQSLCVLIGHLQRLPQLPDFSQPDDEIKGAAGRLADMFARRLQLFDEQLLQCDWSGCERLLAPGGIEGPPK